MDAVEELLAPEKVKSYRWADSDGPAEFAKIGELLTHQRTPQVYIHAENPAHRLICMLRARGHSLREIAEMTGYTEQALSQITRQPWAVKRITEFQAEFGLNPMKEEIARLGKAALFTLEEVMTAPSSPANVKSTTAQYLVNRFLGRPKESIEINDNRRADQFTDAELAQIAAQV